LIKGKRKVRLYENAREDERRTAAANPVSTVLNLDEDFESWQGRTNMLLHFMSAVIKIEST
jgi:hypothetical protein